MKTYHIPILLFLFSSLGLVRAMPLEDFNNRFEEELAKISSTKQEKDENLDRKYLAALLRLEANAREQGNLQLVQATRKEIIRIETGRELEHEDSEVPSELKEMQRIINNLHLQNKTEAAAATITLVDNLKSYATNRSMEATRQNKISEAITWQKWEEALDENEMVNRAYAFRGKRMETQTTRNETKEVKLHDALKGRLATIQEEKVTKFSSSPGLYRHGKEPEGKEKRIRSSTPSMQGTGSSRLIGTPILIEEKDINKSGYYGTFKEKSLIYVPRLVMSPLVGKTLDRSLVVFDLYKRGTGSKRSIIRTESLLLPPLQASDKVVIDAGAYEYETQEYDSAWSSYEYKNSTADEFYGYIVTIFNKEGELIFQRATERALDEYARKSPP